MVENAGFIFPDKVSSIFGASCVFFQLRFQALLGSSNTIFPDKVSNNFFAFLPIFPEKVSSNFQARMAVIQHDFPS